MKPLMNERTFLTEAFYHRAATTVARELIGKILCRRTNDGLTSGRIVETEAYLAKRDPASHSHRGKTNKNASMFGPPGRAYVYPIHARYCFNAVTEPEDVASAVLIRAVEPMEGVDLMQSRRRRTRQLELARGPARLCEAFAIDRQCDGVPLTSPEQLWIADDGLRLSRSRVGRSPRVGVTSARESLLRFFLRDCRFVSPFRPSASANPGVKKTQ